MLIAGIDDAGRGSIIGPLAIAGVLIKKEHLSSLDYLGIKDSKLISPRKREQLAEEIKSLSIKWHVIMLPPEEIDRVVLAARKYHKLNRLEAQTMANIINILKPKVAYVDASDVLAERYKQYINEKLTHEVRIVSEHKADAKYPIVSAASIIAKVERDRAITILQDKYGNLGSGYPSDLKTLEFLEIWIKRKGTYPDFVRKSWAPAKRIVNKVKKKQNKLI